MLVMKIEQWLRSLQGLHYGEGPQLARADFWLSGS